ncbi:MAG: cell envelope integrity protein TolA [Promethearchaeota archaeon]
MPEWLKWKEEEVKNIINNLEAQIMNEARIIAAGNEPSDNDIRDAILNFGTPESIAKPYKSRGTPKFFLTQELFEFYLRSLFFFFGIIIILNIIVSIFRFIFDPPWWNVLGDMFGGMWIGCLIAAVCITVVFVYFSMEGFLPQDFGIIPKRLALLFPFNLTEEEIEKNRRYTRMKIEEIHKNRELKLEKAKSRVSDRLAEAQLIREEKHAEARMLRRQKDAEARKLRKQKVAAAKEKQRLKKKYPVTVGDLVFGAVGGIIFGLLLILQPFADITGLFHPDFLNWIKLFGLLIFISGLFSLVRLAMGVRNHTGQQIMLAVLAGYNILYIPLFLLLLNQPEIFPISLFSGGLITSITVDPSSLAYIIYFWVIILINIGIIAGMIENFHKISKLQRLKKDY